MHSLPWLPGSLQAVVEPASGVDQEPGHLREPARFLGRDLEHCPILGSRKQRQIEVAIQTKAVHALYQGGLCRGLPDICPDL